MPTIKDAKSFLDSHVGQKMTTVQSYYVRDELKTWTPGPRTLSKKGVSRYLFDDSTFQFQTGMKVLQITDRSVTIAYPNLGNHNGLGNHNMVVSYALI